MTKYFVYDGGIAVVIDSKKAFAWDDVDNAWKPVVASETSLNVSSGYKRGLIG